MACGESNEMSGYHSMPGRAYLEALFYSSYITEVRLQNLARYAAVLLVSRTYRESQEESNTVEETWENPKSSTTIY